MHKFRICKTVALFGFLSALIAFSSLAQAQVDVNFFVIPALRVDVAAPGGYVECTDVDSGYYDGIWHSGHRICYYGNTPEAGIWISGYWGCASWVDPTVCDDWRWFGPHWVRKGYWEHGIKWHRNHQWFWWRERNRHIRPFPVKIDREHRSHDSGHGKHYNGLGGLGEGHGAGHHGDHGALGTGGLGGLGGGHGGGHGAGSSGEVHSGGHGGGHGGGHH